MYCTHCGAQISNNSEYCPHCGSKMYGDRDYQQEQITKGNSVPNPYTYAPVAPVQKVFKKKRVYQKIPTSLKVLSFVLIFLFVIFGSISVFIVAFRLGITENNVRASYQDGYLSDLVVQTSSGEKVLVDLFESSVKDAKTGESITIEYQKAKDLFDEAYINNFIEDALADGTKFLIDGKTPRVLNASNIVKFIKTVNYDIEHTMGYSIPEQKIDELYQRLTEGNLCFLNIGGGRDAFIKNYGFDIYALQVFLSPWILFVFIVISLAILALIIWLNRKNLPVGLIYCGWTLTIFGGFNLFVAIAVLIISSVKWIFFFSKILYYLAVSMGIVSLTILAVGIGLLLVGFFLKRNSEMYGNEQPIVNNNN